MEVIKNNLFGWDVYVRDGYSFDDNKIGKWMFFFKDINLASELCEKAIETHSVYSCKHSDIPRMIANGQGVACFYLNIDDFDQHKKILSFMMENNMINKTKLGKLYNISFKLDSQTKAGEYGSDFEGKLKLEKLVNLSTGEFIV